MRHDLLERVQTKIRIPPLRERRGDVLPLARHFTNGACSDRCLVGWNCSWVVWPVVGV